MAKRTFPGSDWRVVGVCALVVCYSACASRVVLRDEMGQPIAREEVEAKKHNKNFWLYTIGGGALSFGASFFAGSMINRSVISDSSDSQTALWIVAGAGTLVGTALFAQHGRTRDFNQAVEAVKEDRQGAIGSKIVDERKKQEIIASERKKLEDERKRQEMEREALLRKIRKKQIKENDPRN